MQMRQWTLQENSATMAERCLPYAPASPVSSFYNCAAHFVFGASGAQPHNMMSQAAAIDNAGIRIVVFSAKAQQ